jgi:hypothetical protein
VVKCGEVQLWGAGEAHEDAAHARAAVARGATEGNTCKSGR